MRREPTVELPESEPVLRAKQLLGEPGGDLADGATVLVQSGHERRERVPHEQEEDSKRAPTHCSLTPGQCAA